MNRREFLKLSAASVAGAGAAAYISPASFAAAAGVDAASADGNAGERNWSICDTQRDSLEKRSLP